MTGTGKNEPDDSLQRGQAYALYPLQDERAVDFSEVVLELWRRKILIVFCATLFGLAGAIYALIAEPRFVSEVLLAPTRAETGDGLPASLGGLAGLAGISISGGNSTDESLATLRSRVLIENLILDEDLMPILFADLWDDTNDRWMSESPDDVPDIREAVEVFVSRIRSVREDAVSGLVTLRIEWKDAEMAENWANKIVSRANNSIRERDLLESNRRLDYLKDQMAEATLIELRSAIANLIESEIQTIMVAQAKPEYAFRVIDPARIARERSFPKRKLIVILALFVGGVFGVCIVLGRWILKRPSAHTAS